MNPKEVIEAYGALVEKAKAIVVGPSMRETHTSDEPLLVLCENDEDLAELSWSEWDGILYYPNPRIWSTFCAGRDA